MKAKRTRRKCFHLLPILAAVGCSNVSLLGISADVDEQQPSSAQLTAYAPRHPTVITGKENEYPLLRRPSLGDLDGDGLDDFIVEGLVADEKPRSIRAFLFYGRTDFPAQITLSDADAELETGETIALGLGDLNGDGLADLGLSDFHSSEIVFGSSTRLTGERTRFSMGLAWHLPDPDTSNFYLWPIGDLNGDGMDELRVTVLSTTPEEQLDTRPLEIVTDYIVSGRQTDWPSGTWDPSWAVATLGDEPPAYEDDGAKTVVQRLVIAGTGDFDGDGYRDLLALGRFRMYVFYGGPGGLQGTLTPERADASLTWPHDPAAGRAEFGKTIPVVLGDVDGDGTTDLGVPNRAELGIVYSTKQRWSGRVALQPELTIVRATTELPEQNWWLPLADDISYGQPLPQIVSTQIRIGVADLDGDAQPELIVHENRLPTLRSYEDPFSSFMYVLTGPSQHATGRYVLRDSDLYKAESVSDASAALSSGLLVDTGGDFDGDGSTDLLFSVQELESLDQKVSVQLIPGAPHAPD